MAAGVRGNANIMKAITRARAIVAKGSGMRDTTRIIVPGAWQRAASPEREWDEDLLKSALLAFEN